MADNSIIRMHGSTITPQSYESIGAVIGTNTTSTASTWPAANRAIFVPFSIWSPFEMKQIFMVNGTTASGNIDIGLYIGGQTSTSATRIYSTGSTANSGALAIQSISASMLLTPGRYYMALVVDNATATPTHGAPTVALQNSAGMAQMATAFPLPATATLARVASNFMPILGITSSSVI